MKRLIKKAEFVYCVDCGFDNGDFGFPTKNTVWNTLEELEKENPDHRCPYCGGELGRD